MDHAQDEPEATLPRFLLPTDLDTAEQPTSPLVISVIEQAERSLRTQTSRLAVSSAQSQEQSSRLPP